MGEGEPTGSAAMVLACSEISCEQKVKIAAHLPPPPQQKLEITSMQTAQEAVFGKPQQTFMPRACRGALTPNPGAFILLLKTNKRTRK